MGLRCCRFWPIRQAPIEGRTGSTAEIGNEPGGQNRRSPPNSGLPEFGV